MSTTSGIACDSDPPSRSQEARSHATAESVAEPISLSSAANGATEDEGAEEQVVPEEQAPPETLVIRAQYPEFADHTVDGWALTFEIENQRGQAVSGELTVTFENGADATATWSLGEFEVQANTSATIEVDLSGREDAVKASDYAGSVLLAFAPTSEGVAENLRVSDTVYIHWSDQTGGLLAYDGVALRSEFRAGDVKHNSTVADQAEFETPEGEPAVLRRVRGPHILAVVRDFIKRMRSKGSSEMSRPARALSFWICALGVWLFSVEAQALGTVCVKTGAKTVDSGFNVSGFPTEDWFAVCNSNCLIKARYANYRITTSGGTVTSGYLNSNGCATVPHGNNQTLEIFSAVKNGAGLFVALHDAGQTVPSHSSTPGSVYEWTVNGLDVPANSTLHTSVTAYGQIITPFSVLIAAAYRWVQPYSNGDTVYMGINQTTCNTTAHWGNSSTGSTSKDHLGIHYTSISRCSSNNRTRFKFHIAHEFGHGVLCIHSNRQGCEAGVNNTQNGTGSCSSSDAYSIFSKEWDSIGFREGYAHLVAARIWNNKANNGQFRWFNSTNHNLEYYTGGSSPGGRLENICCSSSSCMTDSTTNEDWMNFLWDIYNNVGGSSCPYQPDSNDMADVFASTVVATPGNKNYYEEMRVSAASIMSPSCLGANTSSSRIGHYASHNGIDN